MRGAVPHDGERFRVSLGKQSEANLATRGKWGMEVDLATVDLGEDCGFCETGADSGGDVVSSHGTIKLFAAAIGQNYGKHGDWKTFGAMGL
jgi:hypothetical protein